VKDPARLRSSGGGRRQLSPAITQDFTRQLPPTRESAAVSIEVLTSLPASGEMAIKKEALGHDIWTSASTEVVAGGL